MRSLRVQRVSASCGMITDRSGRPLAMSVPVKAIWADPKEMYGAGSINVDGRRKALTNVLNIPLDQLSAHINANPKGRLIYLACQVNPDMTDYVKRLKLPRIHLCEGSRRYYPSGEVTVHLIGFISVDSQGTESVEKSFDKWPTRQPGKRTVRKGRYGRVIEDISSIDSQAVHNPALSIDERPQALVYCELNNAMVFSKAESGSTVLVDVNTGEVLAMASSPSYNPNNLSGTPKEAMRSRTITNVFESGSVIKPMMVMTALQRGVVRENLVFDTIPYRTSDREIKDMARYSELTLTGVLRKSNNAGASELALAMPPSTLTDTYLRLRLGEATNLGLVEERSGSYPRK